jgi:O-methyltransferase involved in polyketide biosynthesis
MTSFKGHISESAFLVNESRARSVELSRDKYAHLWVGDSTRRLWEAFSAEVYPHDALELGLRNRFFLERLDSFSVALDEPVFVNIGAGFTSYPFLTDRSFTCVEVDYSHVIDFKRSRLEEWTREGLVPPRDIRYVPCDLKSTADRKKLAAALEREVGSAPSFVLMEGLTYYLSRELFDDLVAIVRQAQPAGSILAFDFWTPESAAHQVFLRFEKFFAERFAVAEKRYNFMDRNTVASINDYKLVELRSVAGLERMFSGTRVLQDPSGILPESYAILAKGVLD